MTILSSDVPVEEVTDLREARQVIAQLRWAVGYLQRYASLAERVAERAENEFTAILEPEHAQKLRLLYQQGQLLPDQEPGALLDDLVARMLQQAIDQRWSQMH
jgi:DNA-directed RNA polymerase subunit F